MTTCLKNTAQVELYLTKLKEKRYFGVLKKNLHFCFYEKLQDKIAHSLCSVGECLDSPPPQKQKAPFLALGHGLNALLCHPGPKKTRAPFSLPAARTQWSLLMQLLLPVSVPTAEDDGHAKPTQRQNSLHNISRENTVHAERERKLNQHHTGGCVLPQLIFSLRAVGAQWMLSVGALPSSRGG